MMWQLEWKDCCRTLQGWAFWSKMFSNRERACMFRKMWPFFFLLKEGLINNVSSYICFTCLGTWPTSSNPTRISVIQRHVFQVSGIIFSCRLPLMFETVGSHFICAVALYIEDSGGGWHRNVNHSYWLLQSEALNFMLISLLPGWVSTWASSWASLQVYWSLCLHQLIH